MSHDFDYLLNNPTSAEAEKFCGNAVGCIGCSCEVKCNLQLMCELFAYALNNDRLSQLQAMSLHADAHVELYKTLKDRLCLEFGEIYYPLYSVCKGLFAALKLDPISTCSRYVFGYFPFKFYEDLIRDQLAELGKDEVVRLFELFKSREGSCVWGPNILDQIENEKAYEDACKSTGLKCPVVMLKELECAWEDAVAREEEEERESNYWHSFKIEP